MFPAPDDPQVAVDVLRGDLGLDDGRGQSIFSVDQGKIDSGALVKVARANLLPGESLRLDDGTVVRFDGVGAVGQPAGEPRPRRAGRAGVRDRAARRAAVLAHGAAAAVLGQDHPAGEGRAVVEIGGLARTDRAGYGEEFDRLRADLLARKDT